jgi:DmsE family decaheme c-type cytochrome
MTRHRSALSCLLVCACSVFGLAQPARAAGPDPTADRSLAGDAVCTRCHDQGDAKPVLSIYQTRHGVKADTRTPGCLSCHGPSVAHVKNEAGLDTRPAVDISFGTGVTTSRAIQVETCLACHRNGQRGHWDGSQHEAAGVACSTCHAVHVAKDRLFSRATQSEVCFACHKSERAQTHRISSHPLAAGKMACSDCHNPHGSTGPTLMRGGSVNETCVSCHAEKRGPFLWEHVPVTEACTNCHTPHGSNISPLLKQRTPFLCQSCHSGDHAGQINSAANLSSGAVTTVNGTAPLANSPGRAQLAGRNCQNCHMLTHGSNHPAGAKLTR